jgi:hypothetical protein
LLLQFCDALASEVDVPKMTKFDSDEVVDLFLPVRFYWVRRARWLKLQKERQSVEDTIAVFKVDHSQPDCIGRLRLAACSRTRSRMRVTSLMAMNIASDQQRCQKVFAREPSYQLLLAPWQ